MLKDTTFINGVKTDYIMDEGNLIVSKTQDVEKILESTKHQRDSEDRGKVKDASFWKFASVPMVIVEELYKKGLNIYDDNDLPLIKREIEINYPYLKTTNLRETNG